MVLSPRQCVCGFKTRIQQWTPVSIQQGSCGNWRQHDIIRAFFSDCKNGRRVRMDWLCSGDPSAQCQHWYGGAAKNGSAQGQNPARHPPAMAARRRRQRRRGSGCHRHRHSRPPPPRQSLRPPSPPQAATAASPRRRTGVLKEGGAAR